MGYSNEELFKNPEESTPRLNIFHGSVNMDDLPQEALDALQKLYDHVTKVIDESANSVDGMNMVDIMSVMEGVAAKAAEDPEVFAQMVTLSVLKIFDDMYEAKKVGDYGKELLETMGE